MPASPVPWSRLEELVRRDPGGRGVAGFRWKDHPLGWGQLEQAAIDLAANARAVGIVTGFCAFDGVHWAGETDGPPGAIFLARALIELNCEVALISDAYGRPVLEVGCDAVGLERGLIWEVPFEDDDPQSPLRHSSASEHLARTDGWCREFIDGPFGRRMTHLIAIERAGPSHTLESMLAQSRDGHPPREQFEVESPSDCRDLCHNMRGVSIHAQTAKIHRLFELVNRSGRPITTIGIADGGNEIGMGKFPWEVLREAIAIGPGGKVACRIATDYTLLAGVSNWAGYALALAVRKLRGLDPSDAYSAAAERNLIEMIVRDSNVVDGISKRREATVDGLGLDEYLSTLSELCDLLAE